MWTLLTTPLRKDFYSNDCLAHHLCKHWGTRRINLYICPMFCVETVSYFLMPMNSIFQPFSPLLIVSKQCYQPIKSCQMLVDSIVNSNMMPIFRFNVSLTRLSLNWMWVLSYADEIWINNERASVIVSSYDELTINRKDPFLDFFNSSWCASSPEKIGETRWPLK